MSARWSVDRTRDSFWPGEGIILHDREARSWAQLVPDLGCQLVRFGAVVASREVETFLQPTDETPAQVPSHYGAPVLFPFPNRLRGGQARFGGRTIQVDRAPGQPHAIHGLIRDHHFRVERLGVEGEAAVARLAVDADEQVLRQFPFPFRLALTCRLSGAALRIDVEAENTGDGRMPLGFGWHPYFRLPLVPGGDRRDALVRVPAQRQWQLDETLVPTGEIVAIPPERDFRTARPLGTTYLDDVYTDLKLWSGASVCELRDPAAAVTLTVSAGPTFREWVVYAPPTRPTICFEPYTCPTDAFNLVERGLDAGVIVLPPGERWTDWLELRLRADGATRSQETESRG